MEIVIPLIADLDQNQKYILMCQGEEKQQIRLHDYKTIFSIPGLYEKIVYEILECN